MTNTSTDTYYGWLIKCIQKERKRKYEDKLQCLKEVARKIISSRLLTFRI